MKLTSHLGVSAITGVAAFFTTHDMYAGISCFLAGWLIDLDHVWDFYRNAGRAFTVRGFFETFENGEIEKAYLYLHSYELLFGLICCCFLTHFNYLLSFTTLGFAVHLFLDQLCNPVKPLGYFFIYRVLHGYHADRIFVFRSLDVQQ